MVILYAQATGVTISDNCWKCTRNAFNELKEKYDERRYIMKRGKIIANPFGNTPSHFNRNNVTDEISEQLINLGHGDKFERWQ